MGWCCRRYSIRKRGLEGEWRRQSGWISGQAETAFQPASRLAGRHGADHLGGAAGIPAVLNFRDVQIEPGGTPVVVRMAKLQDSVPHWLGMAGVDREAGAPEYLEREGLRGGRLDGRCQLKALFQFAPGEVKLPLPECHAKRPCHHGHGAIGVMA